MQYLKDIERYVESKVVFCGIDVHLGHWDLCYFSEGEVIEKTVIEGNVERLIKHTKRYYGQSEEIRFVYEAGFSGFDLYRKLQSKGYSCMVTPPSRMPKMADKVKTDKRDAEKLSRYYSAGLLKRVYVPPLSVESDRQLLRLREGHQRKMRRVKTQIKSHLNLYGKEKPKEAGRSWTNRYVLWLEGLKFETKSSRRVLEEHLKEYRFLRERIADLTREVKRLSRSESYAKEYKRLSSCKGVGLITGMTFLLEVYDMSRFGSPEEFGSYLGLTPSQHSSGEHVRHGHITREGNARVRRVLVESAWTVIRHDPFLRAKYDRIRMKGTNGKKAIVAVARSLAIRLRRCLLDEENYAVGVC